MMRTFGCIVSNFYIKSQLSSHSPKKGLCCIVSNFYIKSQLNMRDIMIQLVV